MIRKNLLDYDESIIVWEFAAAWRKDKDYIRNLRLSENRELYILEFVVSI